MIFVLRCLFRDGSLKRFRVAKRDTFRPNDRGTGPVFRSSEKQQVIEHLICTKIKDGGAELDQDTELGKYIVQKFPLHKADELRYLTHLWVYFWKRERPGEIAKPWSPFAMPLHYTVKNFVDGIIHVLRNFLAQPLREIVHYFGESVAFYFAFLGFYTKWLILPACVGLIVCCFQIRDNRLDHWLCIPYTIFLIIWASLMLVFWRRESARLSFEWNVLQYEVSLRWHSSISSSELFK
jgi:hypothetical protein